MEDEFEDWTERVLGARYVGRELEGLTYDAIEQALSVGFGLSNDVRTPMYPPTYYGCVAWAEALNTLARLLCTLPDRWELRTHSNLSTLLSPSGARLYIASARGNVGRLDGAPPRLRNSRGKMFDELVQRNAQLDMFAQEDEKPEESRDFVITLLWSHDYDEGITRCELNTPRGAGPSFENRFPLPDIVHNLGGFGPGGPGPGGPDDDSDDDGYTDEFDVDSK